MRNRFILLFIMFSTITFAQTTINIPTDYPTIQAGLNIANEGDTVLVAPGTYYENIIWPDKLGILLKSEGGENNTVIDGGKDGIVIFVNISEEDLAPEAGDTTYVPKLKTKISGFTIQNGKSLSNGAGIFLKSREIIILEHLIVKDNSSESGNGGGIYSENTIEAKNCIIENNRANEGGGIFIKNGYIKLFGLNYVNRNIASKGAAIFGDVSSDINSGIFVQYNSELGGSIFGSVLKITGLLLNAKVEFNNSWGIIYTEKGNLDIGNCKFSNNSGKVIYSNSYNVTSIVKISNCEFINNKECILSYDGVIEIDSTLFYHNKGAVVSNYGYDNGGRFSISNSKIIDNDGEYIFRFSKNGFLTNCEINRNTGQRSIFEIVNNVVTTLYNNISIDNW